MPASPDTSIVTGPAFQQSVASAILVTPTGSTTQSNLAALVNGGTAVPGGTFSSNPTLGAGVLLNQSSSPNITATGSNQATATALVSEINIINTVTAGQGVAMMPAASGLDIMIVNKGANPVIVYGNGSDTIDGNAGTVGISQMPGSTVFYTSGTTGAWSTEGIGTGYYGSLQTQSFLTGLTAYAAGGQASATPLTAMINLLGTVAAANASVVLPSVTLAAGAAVEISVINNGASAAAVFCPSGGTMNGTSNGSSALTNGTVGLYFGTGTNVWFSK